MEAERKPLLLTIWLLVAATGLSTANWLGCYNEEVRRRTFSVSPGDYNPETMTTITCMSSCGAFAYHYAGLTSGKFCYCSNQLPPSTSLTTNGSCDVPCAGDQTQICGGHREVSAYTVIREITGLSLTSDVEGLYVTVGTPVTLSIRIDSGVDVNFRFDYDDGSQVSPGNATDMLHAVYQVPGQYSVKVTANDDIKSFKDEIAATTVRVDARPGQVEVECTAVFATFDEGNCTVVVWWGSSLRLAVSVSRISDSFAIEDPPVSLAGPAMNSKNSLPGDRQPAIIIQSASEFSVSGKIIGWEMLVDQASSTLTVLILQPKCSTGTYCYSDNQCTAGSCESATSKTSTCPTSEQFCAQAATCIPPAASPAASRYASLLSSYKVVQVVTLSATTDGYQFQEEATDIRVEPGYILGLKQDGSQTSVRTLECVPPGCDFLLPFNDAQVGDTLDSSSARPLTTRLAVRAIASAGSKVLLPLTFDVAGNFSLTVVASSTTLAGSPKWDANTTVCVLEGVNASMISGPLFGVTMEPVTFTVLPHTGNNVFYTWLFSHGPTFSATQNQTVALQFPAKGNYSVNVTAYNAVSSKSNVTEIIIQDRVAGLRLEAAPTVVGAMTRVSLFLLAGSSYSCAWDFGDSSGLQQVSEADSPLAGSSRTHTYRAVGSYDVSVNCSNDVTSSSNVTKVKVMEVIRNLQVYPPGAEKGRDFPLQWQVDSGTDITFSVTFGGQVITDINSVNKYGWKTGLMSGRGASTVPLTITASNQVSNDSVSLDFQILSAIVGPSLTSSTLNTTNNVVVTFTVNMAAGSDVTVVLDYGDGQSDRHVQPPGGEWASPWTSDHKYVDGGRFNVVATFSNAAGSQTRIVQVLVLVGIESINCSLADYALYHPPALASLTIHAKAMPTEPTLMILWGERPSRPTYPPLALNASYPHTYLNTGSYTVTVNVSNTLGQTTCSEEITVLEKMMGPGFDQKFQSAAIGLPFAVTFCLYRGPSQSQCNLTFDYNNGKPAEVYQRQGAGKDGCDTHNVTFTDLAPKVINVTAKSYLETVSATLPVTIINGLRDEDVVVTTNGNVNLKDTSILSVQYLGSIMPTAAKVEFVFGDGSLTGSGPFDFNILSQGSTQSFGHTYTRDGFFACSVVVYNDATSVQKVVQVGVFQSFSNARAELSYLADIPLGAKTFGLNGATALFPANKPVQFRVLDDNNAFATVVHIKVTDSLGAVAFESNFSTPEFSVQLNKSDQYKADMTVTNPLHTATIAGVRFSILELVQGLSVREERAQVKVNEHKLLNVSFIQVGTDTCLYVSFGDGFLAIYSDALHSCTRPEFTSVALANKQPLSGLTHLDHVYTSEGFYSVRVLAENSQSSETRLVGFSISALDCSKPEVSIYSRAHYFTNPKQYRKSERIQIQGKSNINCATSYDNTKTWLLERINETDGKVVANISLAGLDTSLAQLDFPARYLNDSLYRVRFVMTMVGSYGRSKFEAATHTYIKVVPSDLIAIMMPGGPSHVDRGASQTLDLNPAAASQDPDVDPNGLQGLTVTNWTCENVDNVSDTSACPRAGFNPSGQSQSIAVGKLQLNGTYRLTATVAKDSRSALAELSLTVVDGTPPIVAIRPTFGSVWYKLSGSYKVLKSSRFSLDCVCTSCSNSDLADYSWDIYFPDYRWIGGLRPLLLDDVKGLVMGQTSQTLTLLPGLFDTLGDAFMRVECSVTNKGQTGTVSVDLQVNSPPVPGTCTVTPSNSTITTEKAWTVSVSGWSDSDGLAQFQLSIHTDSNSVDKQVTSVQTSNSSFETQVCLSEGPFYKQHRQNVLLTVRDVLGGSTVLDCGVVVVRPMDVSSIRKMTQDIMKNQLNELKKVFAEGEQSTCTERATNIVSLLNSDKYSGQNVASNFVNTQYSPEDQSRPSYMAKNATAKNEYLEYQMESERNARAEVRSDLVKSVLQLSFPTVVAVQQGLSFLAEATLYGDEIVQATQLDALAGVKKMVEFLAQPANTKNVPTEDIGAALSNALAVLGCVMDAVGTNGKHGTLDELKDATKDEKFFDYDTSIKYIGSPDDLASANSFEEAQKMHTDQVHEYRQAKTAEIARNQVYQILDEIAAGFSLYSVPGQVMETSSLKLKQMMMKADASSLAGAQLCVPGCDGSLVLANNSLGGLDSQEPVVISVSQTTSFTSLYSDMAQGISPTSNFVTIDLYTENGTKLTFENMSEPFEVTIPKDPNAKDSDYETIDPKISKWSNLMTFVVDLRRAQSSIHMDFQNISGRQFLLVVKMGKLASIATNQTNDECDFVYRVPEYTTKDLDDEQRYRFCLSNDKTGAFKGPVYIGVRELEPDEFDQDISCATMPRYPNGSDTFRGKFGLKMYTAQCLSIGSTQEDWTTSGCVVSKKTNARKTVCQCTHLTTFAGGWVVVPNTIDWNYVFANADFLTNPTIYITVIVTAVLYLIFAIMARYKDIQMAQQLGLAPLADNDSRDKYFYEVITCTGMRRNAGTDSQVCFILSGEDDETDVRALTDNKRKIFRRGQIDGFLMAVPRPLGYLNFMRVWHDNSGQGKFGSWYLNYIMVRDVQTDVKQLFIANRWFAVEEDDGQVDRVIPVANQEQLTDFSYQFGERSRKNFADGHLWFSVIARPPNSRFTCLQRVSCCLCLLYVTMLANAMFYNTTTKDESASNSFSFGPFSIAPEQVFIGVVSNLIVFPINFLLVYLFKKTRPHHKRPSRIDLAIKEVHEQNRQTNINDIKPEVSSIFSVSKTPRLPNLPHDSGLSVSRPGTAMSNASTEELTPNKKKKKFELPWYFTIIAWLLLWVVTLGAVAFVIFYGISFKDETCRKWITSMMVSVFMSVFITQPIKVILFAIILSLIVKKPDEEKEDEADDEEQPVIDQDGEFLHGAAYAVDMARPRKIGYKPPDPQLLEKLREKRLKEIKMWEIIREVIVYSFFLWILMLISYGQMGASNFLYKDTLYKVFIANPDTDIDFFGIRNTDEFWSWTTSGLVNGLRAGPYYNDYPPLKLRAYINDKVSRIMGYATMRQLRIKPGQCEAPDQVRKVISECNVAYNMFTQEEGSFGIGWTKLGEGASVNSTRPEYTYTSASQLNGYPYWGTLGWYSGGGYVVRLDGSKKELIAQMEQLQTERWLDKYSRAVFMEFTVYNPQVNLFAISTILAEFHASGGVVASVRFEPAMLLPYMTSAMLFQVVCEVVYVLFALFFIIRELRELFKLKLNYFRSFWNLVEIGIISMSVSAIVIFFYRLAVTNGLTKIFKDTKGNGYVKFQYVAYWNETFSYMIGWLCFLATLKFLKLLRFNRKMSMLSATLKYSATSLLHFGAIFLIVFLAFAQLFYLTYMHINVDYATFVSSMMAGVLMMMGKFDILSMIMAEPVLTQVFVLLFVLTVTFILVNMFVTILNETFAAVREDINKQGNDYQIVSFMLLRFKQWTGLGSAEEPPSTSGGGDMDDLNNSQDAIKGQGPADHIGEFPDRIERLLKTISSVYMDNDSLAQLYQKKPYDSQAGNKNLLRTGLSTGQGQQRKGSSDIVARVHTH